MPVSVAAPSATLMPSTASVAKTLRSSDFGGGREKNGKRSARAIQTSSPRPWAAIRPSRSHASPVARNMKSSSSALPGPVSQAINVSPSM